MRSANFSTQSGLINVMSRAAVKAGRGLLRDFGELEHLQVSRKGPKDFVSNADIRAEKTLMSELSIARPSYGFLTEESGEKIGEDPRFRWIIDPLDGTHNYLHGFPYWAISIALEKDGELVAGLVYDPVKNEMFHAEKGGGAFLNDRRIRISKRTSIEDALVVVGGTESKQQSKIENLCLGVRKLGATALNMAYVAASRFDIFICNGPQNPWDTAAGAVLIREAGGRVSDISGAQYHVTSSGILASNIDMHENISRIM